MSEFTITIVGTGVVGSSLGMALRQQNDPPRLLGHDKDLTIANSAAKLGAFDKAEWNLVNACEKADLIVLAIPLSGVRATLEAIAPYLKQDAVITDTCPSKQPVLEWAAELLPDHVHFVGGNPLVRPAGLGPANAQADLYQGRLYCLTPAASANEGAVQLLTGLVTLIGGEPFFLDPVEHDGLMTAVEHLPRLLSVALVRTLARPESWRESRKLAAQIFEQVSTGASGDPDGLKDNFLQNQQTLLHWLDGFTTELHQLRSLLAEGEDAGEPLAQEIDKAVVSRRDWLKDYQQGQFADPNLKGISETDIPGFWERWLGLGVFRKKRKTDDE